MSEHVLNITITCRSNNSKYRIAAEVIALTERLDGTVKIEELSKALTKNVSIIEALSTSSPGDALFFVPDGNDGFTVKTTSQTETSHVKP